MAPAGGTVKVGCANARCKGRADLEEGLRALTEVGDDTGFPRYSKTFVDEPAPAVEGTIPKLRASR